MSFGEANYIIFVVLRAYLLNSWIIFITGSVRCHLKGTEPQLRFTTSMDS